MTRELMKPEAFIQWKATEWLLEQHTKTAAAGGDVCYQCSWSWPCPTVVHLTTLSNALAESEKERERLRGLFHEIWDEAERSKKHVGRGWLLRVVVRALSPDSQEKRDG